ncbi:MAG: LysM peptidoglycan-binding domain-containing protein, partial [Clostridia bacterium]|nr:LysM peptidoglycan-binding domain-containing protein [Clostridia bacterium]
VAVRKIPFSQSISVDGASGKCQASATAAICEMNIDVEESRIAIDLGMLIDVTVQKSERVNYVKDVYSTVYKTEGEYSKLPVEMCGVAMCANFTLSDSMSLEDAGISRGCTVIDSSGVANADEVQYDEGGRMTLSGKAKFTLLAQKEGEYVTYDVELPFRYTSQTPIKSSERIMGEPQPYVVFSRHRIDGERIGIDAEIYVSGCMSQTGDICVLDKVNFGDEIEKTSGGYVVCYPSRSDSLWSVAKRYGKAVSDIADRNGIANEYAYDNVQSLEGNSYLII